MNQSQIFTMDEAVKKLGCDKSRNWLFNLLREKEILDETNIPNIRFKAEGYFTTQETEISMGNHKKKYFQTLVTGNGLIFISGLICGAGKKVEADNVRKPTPTHSPN